MQREARGRLGHLRSVVAAKPNEKKTVNQAEGRCLMRAGDTGHSTFVNFWPGLEKNRMHLKESVWFNLLRSLPEKALYFCHV